MDYPKRKPNRLKDFDYSASGAYFVTVCTNRRQRIFWNVGANCVRPDKLPLSQQGVIVENEIKTIDTIYDGITVERYVIMPDHIHLILSIYNDG